MGKIFLGWLLLVTLSIALGCAGNHAQRVPGSVTRVKSGHIRVVFAHFQPETKSQKEPDQRASNQRPQYGKHNDSLAQQKGAL